MVCFKHVNHSGNVRLFFWYMFRNWVEYNKLFACSVSPVKYFENTFDPHMTSVSTLPFVEPHDIARSASRYTN